MSVSEESKDSERIIYWYWGKARTDDETGTEIGRTLVLAVAVASPVR